MVPSACRDRHEKNEDRCDHRDRREAMKPWPEAAVQLRRVVLRDRKPPWWHAAWKPINHAACEGLMKSDEPERRNSHWWEPLMCQPRERHARIRARQQEQCRHEEHDQARLKTG